MYKVTPTGDAEIDEALSELVYVEFVCAYESLRQDWRLAFDKIVAGSGGQVDDSDISFFDLHALAGQELIQRHGDGYCVPPEILSLWCEYKQCNVE